MSDPFIGEIKIVSFNFPPKGWAFCNGQLLAINQNQALFSLLGTFYGGDGRTTFGLPDLRGRVPIHMGDSFVLAQRGGEQTHTLVSQETPNHLHVASASSATGDSAPPAGKLLADSPAQLYNAAANLVALQPGTLAASGAGQPHENMQPYLTLNFCIALVGIFPSRT